MSHSVLLLSGPNLNLLGTREPELYGTRTLEAIVADAREQARRYDIALEHLQSNHEGVLIDAIQAASREKDGLIINAGAFTHYSWAIHDALRSFSGPIIELHLTNPAEREPWRHLSVVAPLAKVTIAGQGADGYLQAVDRMAALLGVTRDA